MAVGEAPAWILYLDNCRMLLKIANPLTQLGWSTPDCHLLKVGKTVAVGITSDSSRCRAVLSTSAYFLNRSTGGLVPPRLSPGRTARRVPSSFFSAASAASRLPLSSQVPADATDTAADLSEGYAAGDRRALAASSSHLAAATSGNCHAPSQRQRPGGSSSLSPRSPPRARRSASPAATTAMRASGAAGAVGWRELDKSGGKNGAYRDGDSVVYGDSCDVDDGSMPARQEARVEQARPKRASLSRMSDVRLMAEGRLGAAGDGGEGADVGRERGRGELRRVF